MIALASLLLALMASAPEDSPSTNGLGQPPAAEPAPSPPPPGGAPATAGAPSPTPATAAPASGPITAPSARRLTRTQQNAILGDFSGGQFIPQPILAILGDPRFDPNVAYILWQLSRRPITDWTLSELAFVAQIAPTEAEVGVPITKLQTLYQFWGLDPNDIFSVSLGANWQSKSTAYSPDSATRVGAISSAECQVDASQMTLGTYQSCIGANQ
jgi:hypothetical protein